MSRISKRGGGKYKTDKNLKSAYTSYLNKFDYESHGSK